MDRDLHLPVGGTTTAAAVVVHPHPGRGGDHFVVGAVGRITDRAVDWLLTAG